MYLVCGDVSVSEENKDSVLLITTFNTADQQLKNIVEHCGSELGSARETCIHSVSV